MNAHRARHLVQQFSQRKKREEAAEERRSRPWRLEGAEQAEAWFKKHCLPEIKKAAAEGSYDAKVCIGVQPYHFDLEILNVLEGRIRALKRILVRHGYTHSYAEPERQWLYEGPHDWDDVLYDEIQYLWISWKTRKK